MWISMSWIVNNGIDKVLCRNVFQTWLFYFLITLYIYYYSYICIYIYNIHIIYTYIIYIYDSQIVHQYPCFNLFLFIFHNDWFDNQGSEIHKNDIFFTFWYHLSIFFGPIPKWLINICNHRTTHKIS